MEELDWDKGLPLDLLSAIAVAGGHEAMKAMRGVSHTWKAGYERSVTAIKLTRTGPMLPPGGAFAGRFPAARSVDFQKCLMAKERPAESLERLAGAQITCVALPDCGTLLRNKTLDDSDIAHLRGLPLLTRLDLYGCSRITDAGIAHLRGLPLEDLDLGRCHRLTEAGLAHALHGMPLRRLVLEDFRGLADVPEQAAAAEGGGEAAETMPEALNALLGAFPLTELSLALTIVADFDLELLPPSLTRLNLGACYNLTDEGLARLRGFPLEDLDLTSDSEMMTLAGLAHLRGMPLRRLILANWDCPGGALGAFPEGLSPLAGMPLTELSLANSDVTDSGLNLLRGLPLTCLSLSGCDRVSPAGLSALEGLSLTDLNLGCWRVTDAVLGHLRGMPLAALTLGGCHLITDAGLLNLRGAPLTCLDLVSTGITGPGLRALRGAPLTDLELCRCRNITCSGLSSLRGFPITKLNLWNTSQSKPWYALEWFALGGLHWHAQKAAMGTLRELPITDLDLTACDWVTGLEWLADLPLTRLNLDFCTRLTDNELGHLRGLTRLSMLSLWKCKGLSESGIASLREAMPFLEVVGP